MNEHTDRDGIVSEGEQRDGYSMIGYNDIKRMYEENLRDAQECERVTESSHRGESYYADDGRPGAEKNSDFLRAFFNEVLYRDVKTAGFVMGLPHGTVIRQGERGSYYRGEKKIYPQSGTTLSRALLAYKSDEDKLLYRLVADMRIAEFEFFIRKFDRVKCWDDNGLTVLVGALAQHYGLETDWLDITNDFNVALFFATCYWDNTVKKWFPLTKEQTEAKENTKYGVIFHAPAFSVALNNMVAIGQQDFNSAEGAILPIGYQPFMRCHTQYGYSMHMKDSVPLQANPIFEQLRFRHNEKLSRDVFEIMDGGEKIYPQEGLTDFYDVLDSIISATDFSEEAFRYALEKNDLAPYAERYRRELESSGICAAPIHICGEDHPFSISEQRIRRANRKDEGFSIEEYYGIQLSTRMVYREGGQ